ncbi:glutathione S-transferase family protein [Actinotignum sp. GS-2025c]|uniref:glutathione S-transferase family protein n=1 Tax=Actinotignum sp. GS-2025c TaxID=3427276 RepID=UPI003F44B99B
MTIGATFTRRGEGYSRDARYITTRVSRDSASFPVEPGRYRLIAARARPWANRTLIVRRLLGLENAISLGIPGPTHDERSWIFDRDAGGVDPVLGIHFLRDAYLARDPNFSLGITVPALVDLASGAVATNDFAQMTLDFSTEWRDFHREGAPDLYPAELRQPMDALMRYVYTEINNGVYRCGFAGSQESYNRAYLRLFTALRNISELLEGRRYLMGDHITEADVRLFTTLVRFDAVYHGHFKCNEKKLTEMPVLWAYARDLFQTPGFGDTVDFEHITSHYYRVHLDVNPNQIVPLGPDTSGWLSPHGREALGGAPFGGPATRGERSTAPGPVAPGEEVPLAARAGHWGNIREELASATEAAHSRAQGTEHSRTHGRNDDVIHPRNKSRDWSAIRGILNV